MYKLIYGVAKRKNNRLLSMDDRPTEFCLDAIVLGDEWIVERLFDEDGSHLTVCHRPILAVLWIFMTSV
jgi:hypothetical protein